MWHTGECSAYEGTGSILRNPFNLLHLAASETNNDQKLQQRMTAAILRALSFFADSHTNKPQQRAKNIHTTTTNHLRYPPPPPPPTTDPTEERIGRLLHASVYFYLSPTFHGRRVWGVIVGEVLSVPQFCAHTPWNQSSLVSTGM